MKRKIYSFLTTALLMLFFTAANAAVGDTLLIDGGLSVGDADHTASGGTLNPTDGTGILGGIKNGGWVTYKIKSVAGGDFQLRIGHGTGNTVCGSSVNASIYQGATPEVNGDTLYFIKNGNYKESIENQVIALPITLAAGEVYTLQLNYIDLVQGSWIGNTHSLAFEAAVAGSLDAGLASVTVDGVAVADADPEVLAWSTSIPASKSSIEIVAESRDANAVITGDTGTQAVVEGDNTFNITVTSENGSVVRNYTITVAVPYTTSTDATLKSLEVVGYTLSPAFDAATLVYNIISPSSLSTVTINAVANDVKAQGVTGTGEITLSDGKNALEVEVTSESGATQIYTINIITPLKIAAGDSLALAGDIFNLPADKLPRVTDTGINWWNAGEYIEYYIYSETTQNFSFGVRAANADNSGVSSLNVSTLNLGEEGSWVLDENNTLVIPMNSTDWSYDSADDFFYNISLEANTPVLLRLYCVSNSNNNSLANVYEFFFMEPFDVSLSEIKIGNDVLEGFDAKTFSYDVVLPASTTEIPTVTATATDATSIPTITDATVLPADTATILVTATNGRTETYTINFSVAIDTTLAEIKVDDVILVDFDATKQAYEVVLPFGTTALPVVTATAVDTVGTSIEITNITEFPGTATIVVTATDGGKATYTISFSVATSLKMNSAKFSISPNPVRDVLNISSSKEVLNVEVYSITGAKVRSFNGNYKTVNVSKMNKGIYVISVTTTEGTALQKFIVE